MTSNSVDFRPAKLFATVAMSALLLLSSRGWAADTNAAAYELKDLVAKVQSKLEKGQKSEAELADNIKEFDALIAKHKAEKTEDVAKILMMKAMLYLQVLDNTQKGAEVVEQLKRDFPDTKPGKNADSILESIKNQEASKKIQSQLVEGAKFPEFEEKDVADKSISIANYKGKVVLIDFWATWCGPCVRELPNVLKTYEKYHPKGLEIIGISLDDDKEKLSDFVKDKNMTWQQFFDGKKWGNKLAVKYGIQSIPATFLLNGEGKIIGRDLRGEDLDQAVAKALAKN